jgi:hypothetical protein
VIGLPSSGGADQVTVALAFPAVADTFVIFAGAVVPVTVEGANITSTQ